MSLIMNKKPTFLIVLLTLAILLASWAWVLRDLQVEKEIVIQGMYQNLGNLSRAFEDHLRRTFLAVDDDLQLMQTVRHRPDLVGAAMRERVNRTYLQRFYAQLALFDAEGKLLYAGRRFDWPGVPVAGFFQHHRNTASNQAFIGKPVHLAGTNKTYLTISRRVTDEKGAFAGVAAALIDPNFFSDFYQKMDFPPSMFVVAIGTEDAVIRFRQAADDKSLGQVIPNAPVFKYMKEKPAGTFNEIGAVALRPKFMAYRQMADFPLVVVVGIDETDFLSEYDEKRNRTLIFLILATAAFIGLSVVLNRTLKKNLKLAHDRELERVHLQAELNRAGALQRSLIPPDGNYPKVDIAVVYQPLYESGGDCLNYRWLSDSVLCGYVADIKGHGLSAALHTTAVNLIISDLCSEMSQLNEGVLHALNQKILAYLDEDSFVAVVIFEFDFSKSVVTIVAGGIHTVFTSCTASGSLSVPGSFAGMATDPEFNLVKQPFAAGDIFVFATDGILDQSPQFSPLPLMDFDKTVATLLHVSKQPTRRDDCAALCIHVK